MYKTASRSGQRRVEKAQKPRRGLKSGRPKPGILLGSHVRRADDRKKERLTVLRERWVPYLSDCLRLGITPVAVLLVKKIRQVRSLVGNRYARP
jgi:hypothetical protein